MSLLVRAATLTAAITVALVTVPTAANATLPGANGRLAFSVFTGSDEIFTMNQDGSDQRQSTDTIGDNFDPEWSPNGAKFVFASTRETTATNVFTMNADGSNQVQLTGPGGANLNPTWSPDGTKIAYVAVLAGGEALFTMNANGTNKTQITAPQQGLRDPDWSRTGPASSSASSATATPTSTASTPTAPVSPG